MVPQNNYTLKHNSLTISSSWRGARWLLAYGKYEWPPYYSSKPKANEVWRFENSHCGGRAALKTHSEKVCRLSLQSFSRKISEKRKHCNSNPEIANAGAPQTTSTSSTSMSAFSPHLHQFRHDLQQQAFPELHPDSRTLLAHIHKKFSSEAHGGWKKWQNEFWQNLQLTQHLLEVKWSPHAGSHFTQTFHGIATLDYQLMDLHA